jgi:Cys-rich repeat protein
MNGFCVAECIPEAEVCDGLDNDCDGIVDEGCQTPCTSDADCAPMEACINGVCIVYCGCASDADCPVGFYCEECMCMPEDCPDEDMDGFLSCRDDCDDYDASVHPGAAEECDARDNDCDGIIDEGCEFPCTSDADCPAGQYCDAATGTCTAYCECASHADCPAGHLCVNCMCVPDECLDEDGDGFLSCQGDCDDWDASIHPGATEECDWLDNNCDGVIDEGCETPCGPDGAVCPAGLACCEGLCVDVLFDPENCGTCGAVCAAGETCQRGVCMQDGCTSDADCDDGDPSTLDYCENGVCVSTYQCQTDADCSIFEMCCAQVCVDLLSDPLNCGACGLMCAAGESCVQGACMQAECDDFTDCDDGNPDTFDYCENGTCFHEPYCVSDADCPEGMLCMDGLCMYDPCPDEDMDGWCTCDGDCDDFDASVHPGAEEICDDGIDNNCDGLVDENCGLECTSDADCDDGDPQTEDLCVYGICVHR